MPPSGISIGRHTGGHTDATFRLFTPAERIEVGAFCSIAEAVRIFGGGEHDTAAPTTFPVRTLLLGHRDDLPDAHTKGATRIGSDVWIGYGAIVLSGVTVGDGAVIGAGAVVAKDVRPYAVVAGNPARELRRRFDDATVERLLALSWWTWPDEAILELGYTFAGDVVTFLERAEAMAAEGVPQGEAAAQPAYQPDAAAAAGPEGANGGPPSPGPPSSVRPGSALRYAPENDEVEHASHARALERIGHGRRVLELGCATGHVTRRLRAQGCRVVAIEGDPEAARLAEGACERMIVADLDTVDLDAVLGQDTFDVVLAGDVLEHLRDPAGLLRRLHPRIRPGGYAVASIPNVAHASVRFALLQGRFEREPTGLLDETHLQFFTRDSALALFEDAGYAVWEVFPVGFAGLDVKHDPERVPEAARAAVMADPDALTVQFVIVAFPVPHGLPPWVLGDLDRLRAERDGALERAALAGAAARDAAQASDAALRAAHAERDAAATQLAAVRATRAWGVLTRYWSLRRRLRRG